MIASATLAAVLIYLLLHANDPDLDLAFYGLGALLVAGISWIDDLKSLGRSIRLAVHGIAAALAVALIGPFKEVALPFLGTLEFGWTGYAVTFLWIVGLTNVYNFMDGIDGIATAQAVVAALGWSILGWLEQSEALTLCGLSLCFGSLGFMIHNWPPARIFMGDTGSAFLGYSFAVIPLLFVGGDPSSGNRAEVVPLVAVAFVWPFLFDSGITLLRRLIRGENVLKAHRSHFYQRLVISGYSHRTVSLLYAAFAVLAATAVPCILGEAPELACLVLVLVAFAQWLTVLVRERRVKVASFPGSTGSPGP